MTGRPYDDLTAQLETLVTVNNSTRPDENIPNLDITSLYITNLYISNLYTTNLDITNFYITNLDITKYLGITNVFFTPVIVKYMKKNLVIANILICQSLGPSLYRGSTVLITPGFKPFTIKR